MDVKFDSEEVDPRGNVTQRTEYDFVPFKAKPFRHFA